jgi:hypothetical protein
MNSIHFLMNLTLLLESLETREDFFFFFFFFFFSLSFPLLLSLASFVVSVLDLCNTRPS